MDVAAQERHDIRVAVDEFGERLPWSAGWCPCTACAHRPAGGGRRSAPGYPARRRATAPRASRGRRRRCSRGPGRNGRIDQQQLHPVHGERRIGVRPPGILAKPVVVVFAVIMIADGDERRQRAVDRAERVVVLGRRPPVDEVAGDQESIDPVGTCIDVAQHCFDAAAAYPSRRNAGR